MLRDSDHNIYWPSAPSLCIAALTLSGCTQLELTLPELPQASQEPEIQSAEFPELRPVPERAQLGYDLRQQREIESGLLSDRENARYEGDAVRYETGQLDDPPPLPSTLRPNIANSGPGALIAQTENDVAETSANAEQLLEERLAAQSDDIESSESDLDKFLDDLGLGSAGGDPLPSPEPIPVVIATAVDTPPEAGPAPVTSDVVQQEDEGPLTITFAPGAAALPVDMIVPLTDLARTLSGTNLAVRIVSGGNDAGLAIDRARAVAVRLVARGVAGDQIDIESGGSENEVVIYTQGVEP